VNNTLRAERAINKSQRQWQVILFCFLWLSLILVSAFLQKGILVMFLGIFGGMAFRKICNHYAKIYYQTHV
jgi:hypothetical protein